MRVVSRAGWCEALRNTWWLRLTCAGEGITIVNSSKLLQITWRTRNAYVYSWPQLVRQSAFQFRTHNMEGWGVCDDGASAAAAGFSGSPKVHTTPCCRGVGACVCGHRDADSRFRRLRVPDVLGPHHLRLDGGSEGMLAPGRACPRVHGADAVWRALQVVDPQLGNQAIINMNELECVEGDVLANIWYSNDIVRINPDTGMVVERLDMASLNRYVASGVVVRAPCRVACTDRWAAPSAGTHPPMVRF